MFKKQTQKGSSLFTGVCQTAFAEFCTGKYRTLLLAATSRRLQIPFSSGVWWVWREFLYTICKVSSTNWNYTVNGTCPRGIQSHCTQLKWWLAETESFKPQEYGDVSKRKKRIKRKEGVVPFSISLRWRRAALYCLYCCFHAALTQTESQGSNYRKGMEKAAKCSWWGQAPSTLPFADLLPGTCQLCGLHLTSDWTEPSTTLVLWLQTSAGGSHSATCSEEGNLDFWWSPLWPNSDL